LIIAATAGAADRRGKKLPPIKARFAVPVYARSSLGKKAMIKDIIVSLGRGGRDPACNFAVSVAETFGAHLLAIACDYQPIIPGTVMGGIPPDIIEGQRIESEKLARAAIANFEQTAKRAGISAETYTINASTPEAGERIANMARRFDLAIVGQGERDQGVAEQVIAESVLFDSGRPVLVVPYVQKESLKLDRVIVCWDGGRPATRAIADAMPFLTIAKQVDVVIVATRPGSSDEVPGADLGQHLARHGVKVDVKQIIAADVDVANTVLSLAADTSADLIVMGGYGHSRLREFVLGGTTQVILDSMTVPTLMSH
jgi:nucleotide-binding universal stress UspA family protein